MMATAMTRQGLACLSSCSSVKCSSSRKVVGTGRTSAYPSRVHVLIAHARTEYFSVLSPPSGNTRGRGSKEQARDRSFCFEEASLLIESAPVLPKLVVLDLDFTVWPFYCWLFQKWELFPELSFSADSSTIVQDVFKLECSLHSAFEEEAYVVHKMFLSALQWGSGRVPDVGAPIAYPEAIDIVEALAAHKVKLAVASRTPAAAVAKTFLERLSIVQYFSSMEIYYTLHSKTKHFAGLKEKTGVPYDSMLFFDDEMKNIKVAENLGVTGILVTDGLDLKSFQRGLGVFGSRNQGQQEILVRTSSTV